MDKKVILREIALALLNQNLDSKNVIDGRDLDRLIFEKARLDKNIKYEFRSYLLVFGFTNRYKSKNVDQNDAFIVEKETIKKFYQGWMKNE